MASYIQEILAVQRRFNNDKVHIFVENYWHWSFYISIFYVVSIFFLKAWMEGREKFELRRPLFVWSTMLAIFSIYGFWMNGVDHMINFWNYGWEWSICEPTMIDGAKGLWSFLFCFSKAPELVDTYFIVLRKQKLIFLHWYHHITVFVYCWFHYSRQIHAAQWFIIMNYFVHGVMYTYYAIRASGQYRPPVWVNMFITLLQLLQMVVGVAINVYVCYQMTRDNDWYCDGKIETTYMYVYWSFAMYFSYLLLFAQFFYAAYLNKSRKSRASIKNSQKSEEVVRNGNISESEHKSEQTELRNGHNGQPASDLRKRVKDH